MIRFDGKDWYIKEFKVLESSLEHIGDVHVDKFNQVCQVYKFRNAPTRNKPFLRVQHPKARWATYYMMRTQSQIMEDWIG